MTKKVTGNDLKELIKEALNLQDLTNSAVQMIKKS